MARLRLFIAIDTPSEIKSQVAAIRDQLKESHADVKWEPDTKLHCTIKFLGDTDEDRLPLVLSTIEEIGSTTPPFSATYQNIGCFPDERNPRVVWVGIDDPDGTLHLLQEKIDSGLATNGFEREQRPFHPHVTLGRVKNRTNISHLLRMLETVTFMSKLVMLREVEVVKSELKSSGSVYTILKSISLGASRSGGS